MVLLLQGKFLKWKKYMLYETKLFAPEFSQMSFTEFNEKLKLAEWNIYGVNEALIRALIR